MADNQYKRASHFSTGASAQDAQRRAPQRSQRSQSAQKVQKPQKPQKTQAKRRSADQRGASATRTRSVSSRTQQTMQRASHKSRSGAGHARAGHGAPQRSSNRLPIFAAVLVLVVVVVVAGAAFIPRLFQHEEAQTVELVPEGQTVTITIPDGSTTSAISGILADAGLLSNRSTFIRAAQDLQADGSMKSGTYDFTGGMSDSDLVKLLASGPNSTSGRITIAEGLTLKATAQAVEEKLGISSDTFLAQAKASNYVDDYPFLSAAQGDSLEGFLYGKTYELGTSNPTADDVIRAMLTQYQTEVSTLDFSAAEASIKDRYGITMSDYDMLTLASIIEKEALDDDDRVNISSVMYNRMKIDMPLQSDATMGYVTGGAVTADDLKTESDYNTYLHKGLTPTPICSPSLASIKAALGPADTQYLYFWITPNNHTFSVTYEQHQQAIAAAKSAS